MADVGTDRFALQDFGGQKLYPGDEGYDDARRLFNAMIDRTPSLIARCTSADDVVAVVNMARSQNVPLSVYGGGHGVTGSAVCDGGVCVDLRGMQAVTVDPQARTARV